MVLYRQSLPTVGLACYEVLIISQQTYTDTAFLQDQLHNLLGPLQNQNAVHTVPTLRISRQQQQVIISSTGICVWSPVSVQR